MEQFDQILTEVIELIHYKNFNFHILSEGERRFLQCRWQSVCSKTGTPYFSKGRKWFLSRYMTRSEIVHTAFKAVITAEEHEARENFKYRNQSVFAPHFNVEMLADILKRGEGLEFRPEVEC